jgi:hypothetical protein
MTFVAVQVFSHSNNYDLCMPFIYLAVCPAFAFEYLLDKMVYLSNYIFFKMMQPPPPPKRGLAFLKMTCLVSSIIQRKGMLGR